jgi:hypothetical protein
MIKAPILQQGGSLKPEALGMASIEHRKYVNRLIT